MGDSTLMQYTPEVRRLLTGKANVYRIPDNGKSTRYGLEHIKLGDGHWAVVHLDFGLHDITVMPSGKLQVSIENYGRNLREIVKILHAAHAKLI